MRKTYPGASMLDIANELEDELEEAKNLLRYCRGYIYSSGDDTLLFDIENFVDGSEERALERNHG